MSGHEWLRLARELDWEFSYVSIEDVYPSGLSDGVLPWGILNLPPGETFSDYLSAQQRKEADLATTRGLLGRPRDLARLPTEWVNALKLYVAAFSLAESRLALGKLRAARFGRDSALRERSIIESLDAVRHTQTHLRLAHDWLRIDGQFDWGHRLLHTNQWIAVATRHLVDDLVFASDPIEFAIGAHVVFEAGFRKVTLSGLASVASEVGDRLFERLAGSIESDGSRTLEVGSALLAAAIRHDRARVQSLFDKWLWRGARYFAIVIGFAMDYLTPLDRRTRSYGEHMREWLTGVYTETIERLGLSRPFFWEELIGSLDFYHHMAYASAYTYRASTFFDLVVVGPAERDWLAHKYPLSWPELAPVWDRVIEHWRATDPGNDLALHAATVFPTCSLCQLMLSGGTPSRNSACTLVHHGRSLVFCSEPCRRMYLVEPQRYGSHRTIVERMLMGEAPSNWFSMLRYFGLELESWGKDAYGGDYPWLIRDKTI